MSLPYTNFMFDIETLGPAADSKILSIACVAFNEDGLSPDEFYTTVGLRSQESRSMDNDTLYWWLKQSDEARAAVWSKPERPSLAGTLNLLTDWFRKYPHRDMHVAWGNGANFDNMIFEDAYRRAGIGCPWRFRNSLCYRTFSRLFPEIPFEPSEIKHHALHDARAQAKHAVKLFRAYRELRTHPNELIIREFERSMDTGAESTIGLVGFSGEGI